jgi:hypothetical protein
LGWGCYGALGEAGEVGDVLLSRLAVDADALDQAVWTDLIKMKPNARRSGRYGL